MSETTSPTWRERAAETRRSRTQSSLLSAARTLFEERGYRSTSVAQIAAQAGVSTRSLYNNFETKAHLAAALWRPLYDSAIEVCDRSASLDGDAPEAAANHLRELTRLAFANPVATAAISEAWQEQAMRGPEHLAALQVQLPVSDRLALLLRRAGTEDGMDDAVQAQELADFLVAGVFQQAISHPTAHAEQTANLAATLVKRAVDWASRT